MTTVYIHVYLIKHIIRSTASCKNENAGFQYYTNQSLRTRN